MIVLRLNMQGEDTIEHTYGKCHEMKLILESKKLMRLKIHHDGFTLVHSLEWWSVVQLKGSMVRVIHLLSNYCMAKL